MVNQLPIPHDVTGGKLLVLPVDVKNIRTHHMCLEICEVIGHIIAKSRNGGGEGHYSWKY